MILNKWRHVWLGVILIVVLVAGASVVAGCRGDEAEGKVLKINVNTEPPSLDPNLATDTTSALVINNIFEGLVHIDPSGEPYPGVAESWDVSDDGLVYTFNLRGDDTWTNGDTVTSQDFKNSWLRTPVSYTHLRAHETKANLVCRLLLEKKKKKKTKQKKKAHQKEQKKKKNNKNKMKHK